MPSWLGQLRRAVERLERETTQFELSGLRACSTLPVAFCQGLRGLVKLCPHAPWYNQSIGVEKHKRRQLEKWRTSQLEIDRQLYCEQKLAVNYLNRESKRAYYNQVVQACGSDAKRLFSIANQLLNRKQPSPLPSHTCSKSLADHFSKFFVTKIDSIQRNLCPDISDRPLQTPSVLEFFELTTSEEIVSLIRNTQSNTCELDPVLTKLLKECAHSFVPMITEIVNMSLHSREVPDVCKLAHIHPPLKKSTLDRESLQNYRPVSNLSYLSKLLEQIVFF